MMQFIMYLSMSNLVQCDITIDIKKRNKHIIWNKLKKKSDLFLRDGGSNIF